MRKADAGTLKYITVFKHAGIAAATFRALPAILQKVFTVNQFDRFYDSGLQVLQVAKNGLCIH
jgi:hypothetical protein